MDDDSLLGSFARDILALRDKLAYAERRFQEEAADLFDVKVGQIVERRGGKYQVTKLTFGPPRHSRDVPLRYIEARMEGSKIKKDGTPSARPQYLGYHRTDLES